MGNHTRLSLSRKRLSRKKVFVKRRQLAKEKQLAKEALQMENSSGLVKDDRALQDILIHDTLITMGFEADDSIIIQPSSPLSESITTVLQCNTTLTTMELEADDSTISITDVPQCNIDTQMFEDNEDSDVPLTKDTAMDAFFINNCVSDENVIVRWSYVWSQLQKEIDGHCVGIECAFRDIAWLGSRQSGLRQKLYFQCRMCNYAFTVFSTPQDSNSMNINHCAVAGSVMIGIGLTQLEELMGVLGIRCISQKTYSTMLPNVTKGFKQAAETAMQLAGIEEAALAIERGDLIDGVPHITVAVDGSWMKRSYKAGKYDSPSGVGVIVGCCTGKVLFVGVRNKYCAVCNRDTREGKEVREHICYKNWSSAQCSANMEVDAIVEGFQRSIQQHGLIYSQFIADGNVKVYKKLRDDNPYKNVTIKKIECRNHLLRNLFWKMKEIAKTKGSFSALRHIIEKRIFRIRTAVTKVVQFHLKEPTDMAEKKEGLIRDILRIPSHVFGEHKECHQLGSLCEGIPKQGEKNLVPALEDAGLYAKIMIAIKQLTQHAESLLHNRDSNCVESFNSVIAKFIGGKRINFGLGAQYETRVNAAVVSYNTRESVSRLHEAMGTIPTTVQLAQERKRKVIHAATKAKRRDKMLIKKENLKII